MAAPPIFAPVPGTSLPPPTLTTGTPGNPPVGTTTPRPPTSGPQIAPPTYTTPAPAVARPSAPVVAAALGAETRRVPDFTGRDAGDAIAAAIAEGFVPTVAADRDARAAVGRVRVQSAAAGSLLRTGSPLTLWAGGGYSPTMIDVPSVVGLTTSAASAQLSRAGIQAQIVAVRGRPGVFTAGNQIVVAQTPAGRVTPQLAGYVRLFVVVP